jgi:F-type H+-transporting ATPase subunit delta
VKSRDVAHSYAQALYELGAEASALEKIEDEFLQIVQLTEESGLDQYLLHPLIPLAEKTRLLDETLGDVHVYLLNLFKLLVERNRTRLLRFVHQEFLARRRDKDRVLVATVFSPFTLKEDLQQEIQLRMAQLTGFNVKLDTRVDAAMLGGVRLQIGDRVLDGSLDAQLEKLREQILSED